MSRRLFISFAVLLCCIWMSGTSMAADSGGDAEYIGGTLDQLKPGVAGRIHTTNAYSMLFTARKLSLGVPYKRINLLEYGQKVDRRLLMAVVVSPLFLLSKARKHFLTVGYTDDEGQQQAMVFRVEKDKVRVVLASLEARTGLRIQFQDEEARKAGKG